jgi:hypothetical protein
MKIYKYKDKQFYSENSLRNYFKEHEKVLFGSAIPLSTWGISIEIREQPTVRAYSNTSSDLAVHLARELRQDRDNELRETDVYMLSDYPITPEKRQEMIEYRQWLRDLPELEGFPDKIELRERPDVS